MCLACRKLPFLRRTPPCSLRGRRKPRHAAVFPPSAKEGDPLSGRIRVPVHSGPGRPTRESGPFGGGPSSSINPLNLAIFDPKTLSGHIMHREGAARPTSPRGGGPWGSRHPLQERHAHRLAKRWNRNALLSTTYASGSLWTLQSAGNGTVTAG